MRPILYRVLLDHLVDYTRVLGVGTAVSSADSEATAYEPLVEESGAVGNPARVAVTFHRLGLSPRPRSCGAPVREERGVISCEVLSEAQVNHFGVTFPITAGVAEEDLRHTKIPSSGSADASVALGAGRCDCLK